MSYKWKVGIQYKAYRTLLLLVHASSLFISSDLIKDLMNGACESTSTPPLVTREENMQIEGHPGILGQVPRYDLLKIGFTSRNGVRIVARVAPTSSSSY